MRQYLFLAQEIAFHRDYEGRGYLPPFLDMKTLTSSENKGCNTCTTWSKRLPSVPHWDPNQWQHSAFLTFWFELQNMFPWKQTHTTNQTSEWLKLLYIWLPPPPHISFLKKMIPSTEQRIKNFGDCQQCLCDNAKHTMWDEKHMVSKRQFSMVFMSWQKYSHVVPTGLD